mmetsp:Transcript_3368/g.12634  ORF Transcript_3368/g.12634 Transcript_3368/m.12634 type:complete len:225 (-) Transcript_3368:708-1382(-)
MRKTAVSVNASENKAIAPSRSPASLAAAPWAATASADSSERAPGPRARRTKSSLCFAAATASSAWPNNRCDSAADAASMPGTQCASGAGALTPSWVPSAAVSRACKSTRSFKPSGIRGRAPSRWAVLYLFLRKTSSDLTPFGSSLHRCGHVASAAAIASPEGRAPHSLQHVQVVSSVVAVPPAGRASGITLPWRPCAAQLGQPIALTSSGPLQRAQLQQKPHVP